MRMYVIFVVAVALVAALLFLLDRGLKAVQQGRSRRNAGERLLAAAEQAEQQAEQAEQRAIPQEKRGPRRVA